MASGILSLQNRTGTKPAPPAVEGLTPNHWTAREFHVIKKKINVFLKLIN